MPLTHTSQYCQLTHTAQRRQLTHTVQYHQLTHTVQYRQLTKNVSCRTLPLTLNANLIQYMDEKKALRQLFKTTYACITPTEDVYPALTYTGNAT